MLDKPRQRMLSQSQPTKTPEAVQGSVSRLIDVKWPGQDLRRSSGVFVTLFLLRQLQ